MTRSGRLTIAIGGCVLFLAAGAPADAGESAGAGDMITCAATRADVATVAVNDLRFGVEQTYAWATAKVHLTMRDRTTRDYVLNGRADPIDKQMAPNAAPAGFSYPGFACKVQHPAIVAVKNCRGSKSRRTCEVGIEMFGQAMAYSVSLTAQRSVVEARLP